MFVVLVTAITTWILMVILNVFNVPFLAAGTVAVLGGMGAGILVPWYRMRQRRKERRAG
jgi:hypothetical protein